MRVIEFIMDHDSLMYIGFMLGLAVFCLIGSMASGGVGATVAGILYFTLWGVLSGVGDK